MPKVLAITTAVAAVISVMAWPQDARAADAVEDRAYTIHDGGLIRSFKIATDELFIRSRTRRPEALRTAAAGAAEDMHRLAETLSRATGEEVELVLYEEGSPHNEYTRRVLTKRVLVRLAPTADPDALARTVSASARKAPAGSDLFIFEAKGTGSALALAEALRTTPGVISADPLLARLRQKKYTPNDPLFPTQWHLRNVGQNGATPGIDVNATNAWNTCRGSNVLIGIVDDGLQVTHPDLSPNVNTNIDHNWNYGDPQDPSPDHAVDFHGTSCGGLAAARGSNAVGVCGAAPEATLVGLRLVSAPASDVEEAEAFAHSNSLIHIKSNSWGPSDDGRTLEGPGPLAASALAEAARTGRGGKGTIFVWAGGNGAEYLDNANYDGYVNSIYTIGIGATDDRGYQATYSEPGACLIACTPSGDAGAGRQDVTTTDLAGEDGYNYSGTPGDLADKNYTKTFSGTSASCPIAAGVIALILQANANLGWRDVQEILIRTATKVNPGDADWTTNAAGFHFDPKYGAGLVNAAAAVALAGTWTNLGPQTNAFSAQMGLSIPIPDNSPTGITRTFDLNTADIRVEHVTLTVDITHSWRGDLSITLTSPAGAASRLAEEHFDPFADYPDWTFMTTHCWGENAKGTWQVQIADNEPMPDGVLNSIRLDVYGTGTADIHRVTASAGLHGAISPSGVVEVVTGTSTSFLMTTETYYYIANIYTNSVSIGGAFGMSSTNYTWFNLPTGGTIYVTFAPTLAAKGTPYWWLAFHKLTNAAWNVEETRDTDGDGSAAWEEYVAGTDPTNIASVFEITDVLPTPGAKAALRWTSVTNKLYAVHSTTNLPGVFHSVISNISATAPVNTWTSSLPIPERIFYRVEAQR